jgi:hypothetical protein
LAIATFPIRARSAVCSRALLRLLESRRQEPIDCRVDSADEKARDARHAFQIASARRVRLEAGDVRLGHSLIGVLREQQRDVDVDAVGDQRFDRGDAFGCRRHLDHQVLAAHRTPEPSRFFQSAGRS